MGYLHTFSFNSSRSRQPNTKVYDIVASESLLLSGPRHRVGKEGLEVCHPIIEISSAYNFLRVVHSLFANIHLL